MLADSETARTTLVSPEPRRQVPPAALCLACAALSWGGPALGGLLAHIPLLQPHYDLQMPTPFCSVSADMAVKPTIWVSERLVFQY